MTAIPIIAPLGSGDSPQIGPYRLLGRLGAGGMGQVYLGQGRDGTLAAVKVVHAQYTADPRFRARFAREVATARAVTGHSIAALLDADPEAPVPWLATEYIAGPSLEQAVAAGGALPERSVAVLAARLAEALVALHGVEVVHRDVKPSNVLLAADGPKLIDFGIARAVHATALTHTGAVLGAPAFMSPEQALGDEAGTSSDVFSLASVLVFATLGRGPFGDSSTPVAMLRRVVDEQPDLAELPDWLRTELEPCFGTDPADRPTATDLATGLAAHQHGSDGAWPPPLVDREPPTVPGAAGTSSRPASSPPVPTAHVPPGNGTDQRSSRLLNRRAVIAGVGTLAAAGIGLGIAATSGLSGPGTRPVRWSFDADGPVGSLAVSGGIPYALSGRGTVYALDPATGRPHWTFALRGPVLTRGALHVSSDTCYVSDSARIYALDGGTGRLRWTKEFAYPVTVSGRLLIAVLSEDGGDVLAGLDPASGATRWTHPLRGEAEKVGGGTVVTDGRVHIGLESRIVTLDAETGTLQWEQPWTEDPYHRRLTATATSLVALIERDVVRFGPVSGTESWRRPIPGYTYPPYSVTSKEIVASGETVYLSGRSDLAAWDLNTGELRWATEQRDQNSPSQSGNPTKIANETRPAVGGDTCYVIEDWTDISNGEAVSLYQVSARSTDDGDTRWTSPLDRLAGSRQLFSTAASRDALFIGATGLSDETGMIAAVSAD